MRSVVALADFLETSGIPVYSPRSNMYFDREEIRLMIGAMIFSSLNFQKSVNGMRPLTWQFGTITIIVFYAHSLRNCESRRTTPARMGATNGKASFGIIVENAIIPFRACSINSCSSPVFSRLPVGRGRETA